MFVFNDTISSFPHDQFSFLHFPSPNFDDDTNNSLLDLVANHQHDILLEAAAAAPSNIVHHHHQSLMMEQQQQHQRKLRSGCSSSSSSKRDRHSKINTLRGPRDRRMRLSLPVAREFFGLQDILGVDKASKTVEWLLFQSRHAIKKLSMDTQSSRNDGSGGGVVGDATRSPSSISDGEVVSGSDEANVNNYVGTKEEPGRKAKIKEKRSSGRVARSASAFHPLTRECRAKARARARARTREKQQQLQNEGIAKQDVVSNMSTTTTTSSWSLQMENNGEDQHIDDEQLRRRNNNNQGIIMDDNQGGGDDDDCLMIMGRSWSPSNSVYNSLHNNNGNPQEVTSKHQHFFLF